MGLDRNKSGVGGSSRSGKELTRWMAKDSHLLAPASASQRNTPRIPVIKGDYGGISTLNLTRPCGPGRI